MNDWEEWRPIPGYEELYEVSNKGNVRSLDRKVWNGNGFYLKKGRILKKSKTTTGYWKVELYDKGRGRKSKKVHRLVAKAFIPKIKDKNLINHIDGNPLNNNVENLEWCSQSENMEHAYEIGLMHSNFSKHKDKMIEEYVNDTSTNVKMLARKYGCSDTSLRRALKEKGIEIRGVSQTMDIYQIDRKKMVRYFDEGLSNKDIAKKFKTNNSLIATYRYQYRKGELKI